MANKLRESCQQSILLPTPFRSLAESRKQAGGSRFRQLTVKVSTGILAIILDISIVFLDTSFSACEFVVFSQPFVFLLLWSLPRQLGPFLSILVIES